MLKRKKQQNFIKLPFTVEKISSINYSSYQIQHKSLLVTSSNDECLAKIFYLFIHFPFNGKYLRKYSINEKFQFLSSSHVVKCFLWMWKRAIKVKICIWYTRQISHHRRRFCHMKKKKENWKFLELHAWKS